MKKVTLKNALRLILILLFALSACSGADDDGQTEEEAIGAVYTAVAQTLAAQPTTEIVATPTLYEAPATITPVPAATTIAQIQVQPSPTFVQVVQQPLCNDALYMNDITIPDGTIMSPGESFVKTWQILNGGTCAWDATYILAFVSGDEMSGIATAVGDVVSSNGQVQVSVTFTAPLTTGTYNSYWQMTDGLGTSFGNTIFANIVVSEDVTATPTATATSEYTETPVNTTVPTETPTATATSTATSTP